MSLCLAAPAHAQPTVAVVVSNVSPEDPQAQRLVKATQDAIETSAQRRLLDRARNRFLFASPSPKDRSAARKDAKKWLDKAQDALQSFDVEGAKDALMKATVLLKPDLGTEGARPLNQLRLALAVAVGHAQRDEKTIASALNQYATRFGTATPPPGLWGPALERRLQTVVARAQTKLRIRSTPPGQAYIDGRLVGSTPLTVPGLAPGRHRIEVRALGHHPAFGWAKSSSTKLGQANLELAPDIGARIGDLPATGSVPEGLRTALAEVAERGPASLLVIVSRTEDKMISVRILDTRDLVVHGPIVAKVPKDALEQVWAAWAETKIARPQMTMTPWALGAASAGLVAVGSGVGVRLWARGTQSTLQSQRGALTQSQAYGIQDQADERAMLGTVLISGGLALITGAAGLVTWDYFSEAQP